jgi:hypothetical protein
MAYLGRGVRTIKAANITADTMTSNGSLNTMQVSHSKIISSSNDVSVFFDGVAQTPGIDYTASASTITFNTIPESGVKILAITNGDTYANEVADGSVTTTSLKTGAITEEKILSVSSSKLTGSLPALDGSALTGIENDDAIRNSSDPAIDTNPSGGVGTLWVNTTSGELFTCTDATTGANVWTNAGPGTGDVSPYVHGASTTVFKAGGHNAGGVRPSIEAIDVSSGNGSTFIANLAVGGSSMARASNDGHSSGYTAGGYQGSRTNQIDKFIFSTAVDATTVASLTTGRSSGDGSESQTHAYVTSAHQGQNIITKYSMATDSDDTSVGNLGTNNGGASAGHSTAENGYDGGAGDGVSYNKIDKYSHSSDGDSSAIADLSNYGYGLCGYSSNTHGYTSWGYHTPSYFNIIDRYSFASENNATDWADLTRSPDSAGGGSSTTHGFNFGGHYSGGYQKDINKFPFATQTNASDIGDLAGETVSRPSGMNF